MQTSIATHHRAIALVLTIVLAVGLVRSVGGARPPGPYETQTVAAQKSVALPAQTDQLVPVDPNQASIEALVGLPGVGPSLAKRIISARDAGARFACPEDLLAVPGIGPKTLGRIAPLLAFGGGEEQTDAGSHAIIISPASSAAPLRP